METDISPIYEQQNNFQDFQPDPSPYNQPSMQQQQQVQPPQYEYMMQGPPPPVQQKKSDFFGDIDKKAWIFIIVALILGFFMGKTMQPIILRTN
jgi:hypothetical protein